MFEDDDQALSRRQLITEAQPRGLTGPRPRRPARPGGVREWAAAEAAPLYRWSSLSPGLRAALRELDEIDERMRRENAELDAAAEWLIAEGLATPDRLGILGGSNGGLLVGAAMTQRPELFRAVVCRVPLVDMIRYERFRVAELYRAEFGSAANPEQFGWLHAYSPYHRVRDGVGYSDVLLTCGEEDGRADPMHVSKMAARLQAADPTALVLLRSEPRAGHGQGKPVAKGRRRRTCGTSCWQRWAAIDGGGPDAGLRRGECDADACRHPRPRRRLRPAGAAARDRPHAARRRAGRRGPGAGRRPPGRRPDRVGGDAPVGRVDRLPGSIPLVEGMASEAQTIHDRGGRDPD